MRAKLRRGLLSGGCALLARRRAARRRGQKGVDAVHGAVRRLYVRLGDPGLASGGIGDDDFTFVVADGRTGSLGGIIDGGAHISGDSIDAVQLGGGLIITVGDDSSDINFVAIEEIQVAESDDPNDYNALIGNNHENFWTFDGRNTGTLEDVDADTLTRFIGFQVITGGDGADTFSLVGTTAGVDGTIDGGEEPLNSFDSIDFSEASHVPEAGEFEFTAGGAAEPGRER